ncbi:Protein of unknown function [Bacillus mycoides]|uniref:Uncharacterized protein n=1 Tax=Bacillus mycoides TaxID=1405 RepID=A0A1D3NCJ5_BACMY|nr:Protein of unknown function [Bacillus mycoides]SCM95759.1 Protein of unknown function [Bacillus mycoides]
MLQIGVFKVWTEIGDLFRQN